VSKTAVVAGSLALSALLVVVGGASAAAPPAECAWLSLGYGRGTKMAEASNEIFDDDALLLAGSVLRESHIWSLRYTRVGFDKSAGDVSFIYDRVFVRAPLFVSAGIGIGLLYLDDGGTTYDPNCCTSPVDSNYGMFDEVGFSWWGQVASGGRSGLDVGGRAFGAIGGNRDYWGIALVVRIGELGGD